METIVGPLLSALIAAAPGLLALATGKATDEEAKAHTLALLGSLRLIDVDGIVAAQRRPGAHPLDVISAAQNPVEIAERIKRLPPLYQTAIRHALNAPTSRSEDDTREVQVGGKSP